MDKNLSLVDYIALGYKCLIVRPIHEKIGFIFLLLCSYFGGIAVWDAINGRNCGRGFDSNDPISYLTTPTCMVRGFIEPLPRARGWEGRGDKRP